MGQTCHHKALNECNCSALTPWLPTPAAALEAGKHVLVDKPMCLDGAEGERMLAAARAHPNQVR